MTTRVNLKTNASYAHHPAGVVEWRNLIAQTAQHHVPRAGLLDGPLAITLRFYLLRPKSAPKHRRYPDRQPDWDKLCRAVGDALEGILYTNDSRIVRALVAKDFGDPPRLEVELATL